MISSIPSGASALVERLAALVVGDGESDVIEHVPSFDRGPPTW